MNKIKVLHLGLDDNPGGIESFLLNISEHIDCNRFQFDYLCYGDAPAYAERFESMGSKLFRVHRSQPAMYLREISRVLSDGYNIFHVHKNSPMDFLPLFCAGSSKLVVHSHNGPQQQSVARKVACGVGRKIISMKSNKRLACSSVAGNWMFGSCAYELFPNSIDLKEYEFSSQARETIRVGLGIGEDEFVYGFVGRLEPQKNCQYLLRVFKTVLESRKESRLLIVGDGSQLESLKVLSSELNIGDRVRFLGRRTDTFSLYSAFDCLCVPSIYEGFPFVTLEAQAAGLPCLVSTAVPSEAVVTELVQRLSLDECMWANQMIDTRAIPSKQRASSLQLNVRILDYDIHRSSQKLMDIYECLVHSEVEDA